MIESKVLAASLNDRASAAAKLVPIISLLLEADQDVVITDTEYSTTRYEVDESLEIRFPQAQNDADVCFVLSEFNEGLVDEGLVVSISINDGSPQPLVIGENCITVPLDSQLNLNSVLISSPDPGYAFAVSGISVEASQQTTLELNSLTRKTWNSKAVRKVLKIFAFGGHAHDTQIEIWANMPAGLAIQEMLNFSEHNLKLSPLAPNEKYRHTATDYGRFKTFGDYLGSSELTLPMPYQNRLNYNTLGPRFARMATMRGLNPFRQRIGLWETNYHLALNIATEVNGPQMEAYYDDIMEAHESGVPYQQVLGAAAKSAAVAMQYGHRRNQWINNECICNYDFAREIHQLYFGIFGEQDGLEYHENTSIHNSGSMLTGIEPLYDENGVYTPDIFLNPNTHHHADLEILNANISGANAFEKIDSLMEVSVKHVESLKNLPIMIIEGLADDSLDDERENQLRTAWAAMGNTKNFLQFIHAYAVSDLFHGEHHSKYLNSFERSFYTANKFNTGTIESMYAGNVLNLGTQLETILVEDEVSLFAPKRNVFGGQTSIDASDSSVIFQKNYNRAINYNGIANCDTCDNGGPWLKDWAAIIPSSNGEYIAKEVAQWLWVHFIGSTDNYSDIEQAHLSSIVGVQHDLSLLMCIREDRIARGQLDNSLDDIIAKASIDTYCLPDSFVGTDAVYSAENQQRLNRFYTLHEIQSEPIASLITEIGDTTIDLASDNPTTRLFLNKRIHYAIGFILATPYLFADGKGATP